jgi:carboxymethylenebutenolidase
VGFIAIVLTCIAGLAGGFYMFNQDLLTMKEETVQIMSGGQAYPAVVESPHADGKLKPAVVLIHSFNGFEAGYEKMMDNMASNGFVAIAPQWQTQTQTPPDEVVGRLILDTVAYLKTRSDVDSTKIGLTGFCAGGRYTMLFLPQITEFTSGVAFYGFPYSRGFVNQSRSADYIQQLSKPMLMIHGTRDQASNITEIYKYAQELDTAGKYFELKVYQGEPHGFMVVNGTLSKTFTAKNAYSEMVTFFNRTLK